jgi:flagellar hook-basal body complex protein FliE
MTEMNPLSSNIINLLANQAASIQGASGAEGIGKEDSASLFANVLEDAFQAAGITDQADKASTLQLLAGEHDSLSGIMIDAQKAELSLNLALQLRNKVLDAYKEIMSMQV